MSCVMGIDYGVPCHIRLNCALQNDHGKQRFYNVGLAIPEFEHHLFSDSDAPLMELLQVVLVLLFPANVS